MVQQPLHTRDSPGQGLLVSRPVAPELLADISLQNSLTLFGTCVVEIEGPLRRILHGFPRGISVAGRDNLQLRSLAPLVQEHVGQLPGTAAVQPVVHAHARFCIHRFGQCLHVPGKAFAAIVAELTLHVRIGRGPRIRRPRPGIASRTFVHQRGGQDQRNLPVALVRLLLDVDNGGTRVGQTALFDRLFQLFGRNVVHPGQRLLIPVFREVDPLHEILQRSPHHIVGLHPGQLFVRPFGKGRFEFSPEFTHQTFEHCEQILMVPDSGLFARKPFSRSARQRLRSPQILAQIAVVRISVHLLPYLSQPPRITAHDLFGAVPPRGIFPGHDLRPQLRVFVHRRRGVHPLAVEVYFPASRESVHLALRRPEVTRFFVLWNYIFRSDLWIIEICYYFYSSNKPLIGCTWAEGAPRDQPIRGFFFVHPFQILRTEIRQRRVHISQQPVD